MNSSHESGMTLIESLIACTIGFAILGAGLVLFQRVASAEARAQSSVLARAQAIRLEDRLLDDAGNAWAVFADSGKPDEIDFYTQDATRRSYRWGYAFDPGRDAVTRYAYDANGARRAGETFPGITSFAAWARSVDALGDPGNVAYDPLFADSTAMPVSYPFGAGPASGGNGVVAVRISAGNAAVAETLSGSAAPTHFTIVETYTPHP